MTPDRSGPAPVRPDDLRETVARADHSIAFTIDSGGGWTTATVTCHATEEADCRRECAEGCEDYCLAPETHATRPTDYCNVVEWLHSDGAVDCYEGPEVEVRSGPIEAWWEHNHMVWRYAALPALRPTPDHAEEGRAACVMTHTEPFDFAQCETHDETFPLGKKCRFDGREPWEVYAEEADEQRQRAVVAEMALDELRALAAAPAVPGPGADETRRAGGALSCRAGIAAPAKSARYPSP